MDQNNRLPDFLIVGTMKSGTTILADYLNLHHSIHIPLHELQYFNHDDNFRQGISWYSRRLIADCDEIRQLDTLLIGEKTPTYSYQPNCAERIRKTIPNTKLIWIFRDPVKRIFSNFLHARKKGAEHLNFRDCVEKEEERIAKNIFKGYVERSKYVVQVERFLEHFSIDQMHYMLFENLLESPQTELNKVAEFLGISHFGGGLPQHHSNPTVMPFSPSSLWLAGKVAGYESKLYKLVRKINLFFPGSVPVIPKGLIQQLESIFEPYNQRLSNITGLDLKIWNAKTNKA